MGLLSFFQKKKKTVPAIGRHEFLRRSGRITDGIIIDNETTDAGEEIVYYTYSVHGVDFQSSELLSDEQLADPLKYAPGAKVGIRYDPKNHGNSILD